VVGVQHVSWPRVRSGRWRTPPLAIGQGASFAVQRRVVERLGGWDERLGTGTRPFPAGEDLDFNYRFLRAGGVAYLTPELRVTHRQWRTETDLTRLHAGYLAGNAGCAIKHLRTDDLAGGAWLWLRLAWGVAFMFAGAIRTRSPLHRRLAVAQARGLALGTAEAFRHVW
jgi:GT2 family glycosyltransferase